MQTQPQTQTQTQTQTTQPLDVLQQFDVLLKNHSIVISDRANLIKLFETIMDLCTQMPKAKLKAALKAATQEPKTSAKAQPKPRAKAQPKAKAQTQIQTQIQTQTQTQTQTTDAGDAPMLTDLAEVKVAARGRGRPRKATDVPAAEANANPNAETAEKKRRGRPKKDKSVTISSNDDEDALIEKMMADVASMQKDEDAIAYPTSAIADPATDDDETEDEVYSPIQVFTGALMRCEEMTPVVTETCAETESMSPVIQTSAPCSFGQFNLAVEIEVEAPKTVKPAAKELKAKAVKAKAVKAKEPKAKAVKAVKEPAAKKGAKAKAAVEVVAPAPVANKPLSSFSALPATIPSHSHTENKETNGKIYLLSKVPTTSFTHNGTTYVRTETDNVYDNMTNELIGVWDHANHEIIAAFDDDDLYYSEEE
jgi:hypothetical protein